MTKIVDEFYKRIGIGRPKSEAIFLKNGARRFGAAFNKLMFAIEARSNGVDIDPYEDKNSSLELSLFVGEHFASEIWRALFQWIDQEQLPEPARVLDLGCENGVLSCFLATLWPHAEVVGLDRSPNAIAAAQDLALRLGLQNVQFYRSDAVEFLQSPQQEFDLIFASLFMHEWLKTSSTPDPFLSGETFENLEIVAHLPSDEGVVSRLQLLASNLSTQGFLISLDRAGTVPGLFWYVRALEEAGLRLSLARSHRIAANSRGGKESFPLNVARRMRSDEAMTRLEEVLSIGSFVDFAEASPHFSGDLADVIFRSLLVESTLFEATCEYVDGSGTRHICIYKTPTSLAILDWTTKGFKDLRLAPLVTLPEMIHSVIGVVEEIAPHTIVSSGITTEGARYLERLDCAAT